MTSLSSQTDQKGRRHLRTQKSLMQEAFAHRSSALCRYCDATFNVRDFRRIAAVAEAVVRCMWPEKAQAMMQESYDDGFQHPGRSTLLRARIRTDINSMLLRRRWFNRDRSHSQRRRSLHLHVGASPTTGRPVFGMVLDLYSGGSSWILSLFPLVLLGYGHVVCIGKTIALLLSLWLSRGGGAFKTYEDARRH